MIVLNVRFCWFVFASSIVLGGIACSDSPRERRVETGTQHSAILGGRASGDDENATVYIETRSTEDGGGDTLRCTGQIIAPALVVTARHCLLKRKTLDVLCNKDGSDVDPTSGQDVRPEPPEAITVQVGSEKPGKMRTIAVREVLTRLEVTVCRSDVGFLVLQEAGVDVRSPIRVKPTNIGEEVSVSGWGYTSDDHQTGVLPSTRSTLEGLRIDNVGPGTIPAGSFTIGGNSVCLGDSGAAAMRNGAVIGVYSRTSSATNCSSSLTANLFASFGAHEVLIERAFSAIGEQPWYDGEPRPGTVDAGVDAQSSSPVDDAGLAQDASNSAPREDSSSSCAFVPILSTNANTSALAKMILLASAVVVLSRRRVGRA